MKADTLKYGNLKGEKVAVYCSSQEEWKKVMKIMGYEEDNYLKTHYGWMNCFLLDGGNGFPSANLKKHQIRLSGYEIIQAADFIKENGIL